MLGAKLAAHLATSGTVNGHAITQLTLVDVVTPQAPKSAIPTDTAQADLSTGGTAEQLVSSRPDVIFHLAAIVSGEAEADFEAGYRINLDASRSLFEAIRLASDDYCELLLSDYTRRGLLDGIALRLPTVCIRPGKPNRAASGFFSNILREPIHGKSAVLPVADTVRHWFASPRAATEFLVHAAGLDSDRIGPHRTLNLPGLSATVAEQIDALGRVVGSDAVALIERKSDPTIDAIVANWPEDFDPQRAKALGFRAETRMDDIIQVYLDDEFETARHSFQVQSRQLQTFSYKPDTAAQVRARIIEGRRWRP